MVKAGCWMHQGTIRQSCKCMPPPWSCRGDGIYKRKELRRAQAADHGPRGVLLNGRDHLSKSEPLG